MFSNDDYDPSANRSVSLDATRDIPANRFRLFGCNNRVYSWQFICAIWYCHDVLDIWHKLSGSVASGLQRYVKTLEATMVDASTAKE